MTGITELLADQNSVLEAAIKDGISNLRVSLPAKVVSFDSESQSISAVPTIRELVSINGKLEFRTLPEIKDIPIQMPRAGNFAITMPIKKDDECLLVFSDLCIDSWWFGGGIQNWNDLRRHDLSDAIAIFSPWSKPNAIPSYSEEALEIRTLDGNTKIVVNNNDIQLTIGTKNVIINSTGIMLTSDSQINLQASNININGILTINGTPYVNHQHKHPNDPVTGTPTTGVITP